MNVEMTESMHETVTSGGAWPLQVCAWLTMDGSRLEELSLRDVMRDASTELVREAIRMLCAALGHENCVLRELGVQVLLLLCPSSCCCAQARVVVLRASASPSSRSSSSPSRYSEPRPSCTG